MQNFNQIYTDAMQSPQNIAKSSVFDILQDIANIEEVMHLLNKDTEFKRKFTDVVNSTLPTPKKLKETAFEYVAQAVAGKHEVRKFLQFVRVCPEWIVASDGHRLHYAPNTIQMASGLYDAKGKHVTDGNDSMYKNFPDWEDSIVWKFDTKSVKDTIQNANLHIFSCPGVDKLHHCCLPMSYKDWSYQMDHIHAAIGKNPLIRGTCDYFKISHTVGGFIRIKPTRVDYTAYAIIMPLRAY